VGRRECHLSFSDLIDNLSIQQIKEVDNIAEIDDFEKEIGYLMHDINVDLEKRDIKPSSTFIRLIIILSQINLYIWKEKEKMKKSSGEDYGKHLILSHQLNGIRNRIKNIIMQEVDESNTVDIKTNINVDGLEGWTISL